MVFFYSRLMTSIELGPHWPTHTTPDSMTLTRINSDNIDDTWPVPTFYHDTPHVSPDRTRLQRALSITPCRRFRPRSGPHYCLNNEHYHSFPTFVFGHRVILIFGPQSVQITITLRKRITSENTNQSIDLIIQRYNVKWVIARSLTIIGSCAQTKRGI